MPEIDLEQYKTIGYLQRGSARQKRAYQALCLHGIVQKLKRFKATLCGLIPLDLHEDDALFEIICETSDLSELAKELVADASRYGIEIQVSASELIAKFTIDSFPYVITASAEPVHLHVAFISMIIEARLLSLGGEKMKSEVKELLLQGFDSAAAFSHTLGLKGDPQERLYELASASDEMLEDIMQDKLDEWALRSI